MHVMLVRRAMSTTHCLHISPVQVPIPTQLPRSGAILWSADMLATCKLRELYNYTVQGGTP